MKRKAIRSVLSVVVTLSLSFSAMAMSSLKGPVKDIYTQKNACVGFTLEAGLMNGESRELVFAPGYYNQMISELVWNLDDVFMVGGVLSFQVRDRWSFNFGYWGEAGSADTTMKDSDWDWSAFSTDSYVDLNETSPQDDSSIGVLDESHTGVVSRQKTHFSQSNATVDKAKKWDINAAYSFVRLTGEDLSSMYPSFTNNASLTGQFVVGLQNSEFAWTARGGNYLYPSAVGEFDSDQVVLTYEHDMAVPYLGFAVQVEDENLGLNAFYKYSQWVEVTAYDEHPLRNLKYKDTMEDGEWYAFGIDASWKFHPDWQVNLGWIYENLDKTQGDDLITNTTDSSTFLYANGAGISHKEKTFTLGVTYSYS